MANEVGRFGGRKFLVATASGKRVQVACPICENDTFMDSGPTESADRPGFRHVVIGTKGNDRLLATPIRFKHCANCGFIVQFVIGKFETDQIEEEK